MAFVLPASVFLVAVVCSMLGLGGGILFTPLQAFLGVPLHRAASTSLFLVLITSLSATFVFRKARRVDWMLALVLEPFTMAGAFLGGLYSRFVSMSALAVVFSVVAAAAGVAMIRGIQELPPSGDEEDGLPDGFPYWVRRREDRSYSVNLGVALPACFGIGVASALAGVGGGVLKVPLMVLLGVPTEFAIGSSAFMVGVSSFSGLVGHALSGHWDVRHSVVLAVVVFLGGQIGARVSVKADQDRLKHGFGWFLLLVSALMASRAL